MSKSFSVLDMVDKYSQDNNLPVSDIFNKTEEKKEEVKTEGRDWTPDASLLEDMPELNQPIGAIYHKDEIKVESNNEGLNNIMDENAKRDATQVMDELSRKQFNIEEAKKRRGYKKLQIPPGSLQTKIMIAASDIDYDNAQKKLDLLFDEIEELYPDMILERSSNESIKTHMSDIKDIPVNEVKSPEVNKEPKKVIIEDKISTNDKVEDVKVDEFVKESNLQVIIDKTKLHDVAWSTEDVSKIKKARSIELKIIEDVEIKIGDIEEVEENMVDNVLSKYTRKTNDVVAALPASKYRATFTGLTYPEVLDLSTSQEMNTLDGEWKKWSICFNHIKNPSIGEFEEYYIYNKDGKEYRVKNINEVPDGIQSHQVTKFEDFLRKTSYIDLDFMLWKILCATTRNKEIIAIDCKAVKNAETDELCNHTYDWIYSPEDLLVLNSINPTILEEMKEVGEASSFEDCIKVYKTSSVIKTSSVELSDSKFILNIGHISAYEYLNNIYSFIKSLEETDGTDPTIVSKGMAYATLVVIKSVLLPSNNKYLKVSTPQGIVKVLNQLNEVDWQTISEITKLSIEPYQFKYSLRDIVCPSCKNKSSIEIEDMSKMLFILALSLSSVQVTLKKD